MLILIGPDSSIELDISGYQFASVTHDGCDSEWLQVSGTVKCPRGRWKFADPCLTTFELSALSSWMRERLSNGRKRVIDFTEPNLRFEHIEDSTDDLLRVHLSHEAAPPWATEEEKFGGYAIHIPFAAIDFHEAATAIEQLCRTYPVRAVNQFRPV